MGWRSSTPSSSSAKSAVESLEILDLILTTRRSRAGRSSVSRTAPWYRPLRMCRSLRTCSRSHMAIQTASVLRRGEVRACHATAEAAGRGTSALAAG